MQISSQERNGKRGPAGRRGPTAAAVGRVCHIDDLELTTRGRLAWARAFGPEEGTEKLSLYVAELAFGDSAPISLGESEAALYACSGRGNLDIGGRDFTLETGCGAYVRRGEPFRLRQPGAGPLRLLVCVCPTPEIPPWRVAAEDPRLLRLTGFDADYPDRVVRPDQHVRETTGDRWFRIMVGPQTGSRSVTQFLGMIPLSRAPEHYHRYEEVILILSGEGRIWMNGTNTPVRPGSLIFLPRELPHSLECTVDEGLKLLGMFYPAGSPAVSYEADDSA